MRDGGRSPILRPAPAPAPEFPPPPPAVAEYFRQFAFVASLLGGFSFAFFGALVTAAREHRVVGPSAALALASSACFLVVTLGNTFAAAAVADADVLALSRRLGIVRAIGARQAPLSMVFLAGTLLLLLSAGAAGWGRSRRFGLATSGIAAAAGAGVLWALWPFLQVGAR